MKMKINDRKEKKRKINIDLVVLPSHDRREQSDLIDNIAYCHMDHCRKRA